MDDTGTSGWAAAGEISGAWDGAGRRLHRRGRAVGTAPAAADSVDGRINPASAIRLSLRGELTFGALGKTAAKSFMVTENGYTRTFNASSTNCGRGDRPIARFSPDAHAGPTATFTVTPLNPGYCSITVSDDGSGSVRIPVVVSAPSPTSSP